MRIDTIVVGSYQTNCYIVSDEETNHAFIVDPGFEAERIQKTIKKKGYLPQFIVNTHGHADHIGGNYAFNLPIYIHEDAADLLTDSSRNLSLYHGAEIVSPKASRILKHGDKISFGKTTVEVLHTPGHTPGCICLKIDSILFTGDTLFRESIGRTDLPDGNSRQILASIKKRLLPLSDGYKVYPGHGPESDLGWEKKHNFYISSRME
ncbi:MAG: MBL fold metallo-hydrolase [Candidatus Omnitrophica bacterium]|nr:MBL fold metallo-hydrolase [Candidatus Omnitrophota bacterium]